MIKYGVITFIVVGSILANYFFIQRIKLLRVENQTLNTKVDDLTVTLKSVRDNLNVISGELSKNSKIKNEIYHESLSRQRRMESESQQDACANYDVPDGIIRMQKQNPQLSP